MTSSNHHNSSNDNKEKKHTQDEDVVDEDLVNIFIEEARDILQQSATLLEQWQQDPNNQSYLQELQRELHTMKGGARMVNQQVISTLAHELESFFASIASNAVTHDRLFSVIQDAYALLEEIIDCAQNKKPYPRHEDIINHLRTINNLPESEPGDGGGLESNISLPAVMAKSKEITQGMQGLTRVRSDLLAKLSMQTF